MAWTPPHTFVNGTIADATEVNENLTNLAAYVDLRAPTATVATLPASPADGQVVRYQNAAMATDGIVWTFRYNAASASGFKWEFVGGGTWLKQVNTAESTDSTTYVALATAGPSITSPLAGEFIVAHGYEVGSGSAYGALMSLDVGTAAAIDANAVIAGGPSGNTTYGHHSRRAPFTLAANDAIVAKYKTAGTMTQFAYRELSILPVRVTA